MTLNKDVQLGGCQCSG